ncbi:histidine ammonia-lyase [Arthrobacter sp. ok909]|uniref:HAL/PAL/TAL family ammonia-lyase n=1 Tax=Arthrobacter sp. ok909 TaxID=1761746 RepID=UPI00088866F5|nr:aromatic amino acid ammonia-lyase [Arthrobacter sp. ok909]SDP51802.1 histidine ammonia-lyase [Arthrobacter sp. ok909]
MEPVTISDLPMTQEELVAVAEGAPVALGEAARERIAASRALLEEAMSGGDPIYGLSTRVGHGKDTRVPRDELERQQQFLVASHGGSFGPLLDRTVVRAAMAVRVNGMARGGSGASPAAADTLLAMLNAGVHPVLHGTGSVGAADISPMAGIAQVALGTGTAEFRGETLPGAEALRRAGIAPLRLEGRDGLALISANGVSIGHGALVLARAARTASAADQAAVLSIEATRGNPSVFSASAAAAKPYPGQVAAAAHLRGLLEGSLLLTPGGPRSVQDALSFRVIPQVHGAFREFLATAEGAVDTELNSASDNPLVDVASGSVLSNGNFHPMVLAIAFDALRVALVHVGQLSERRMSHLWTAIMAAMKSGPPPGSRGPAAAPGVQLRYAGSACYTELRLLAASATLDSTILDVGVEDHATGAMLSVRKTEEALGLLEDLLAIEVLLAADLLNISAPGTLGAGAEAVLRLSAEAADGAESAADVHRKLRERFPEN